MEIVDVVADLAAVALSHAAVLEQGRLNNFGGLRRKFEVNSFFNFKV